MWFIIGVTGFISPVLLWLFQKRLVLPEDEQPTKADEDGGRGRNPADAEAPGRHRRHRVPAEAVGRGHGAGDRPTGRGGAVSVEKAAKRVGLAFRF